MASKPGDYDAVRKDIAAQLKKPGYDDGSAAPVFVRLAWYVFLLLCLQSAVFSLQPDSSLTMSSEQALRRHIRQGNRHGRFQRRWHAL